MAESKRIADRAYVAVGSGYNSYVITEHLGGPFYKVELEFNEDETETVIITGKHYTDTIEAIDPWAAIIVPDEGLDALYHAGGTVNVWVKMVAMSAGQALIRGDVLKGGQLVVPAKDVSLA